MLINNLNKPSLAPKNKKTIEKGVWIRTKDGNWYIFELRGVCFVSWVNKKDKDKALVFPEKEVQKWISIITERTDFELECIHTFE